MIENRNPADTSELVGLFPASSEEDVAAAVDAAKAAYDKWRLIPAPKRAEIFFRAAEILIERKEEYARSDDPRDGQGAGGNARRRAGSHRHDVSDGGRRPPAVRPDHSFRAAQQICDVRARAGGRCGLITPWNFPMAIPSWKAMPALICGNTVVLNFMRILQAEEFPLRLSEVRVSGRPLAFSWCGGR